MPRRKWEAESPNYTFLSLSLHHALETVMGSSHILYLILQASPTWEVLTLGFRWRLSGLERQKHLMSAHLPGRKWNWIWMLGSPAEAENPGWRGSNSGADLRASCLTSPSFNFLICKWRTIVSTCKSHLWGSDKAPKALGRVLGPQWTLRKSQPPFLPKKPHRWALNTSRFIQVGPQPYWVSETEHFQISQK